MQNDLIKCATIQNSSKKSTCRLTAQISGNHENVSGMGLSLKKIEERIVNVGYHSISSLKCVSSLWQLKISTIDCATKQEALLTAEVHPTPLLTSTCHLNSVHNKHHPPVCFPSSTQLTLHLTSYIFTPFQEFSWVECCAHNKHSSLRRHCTYRQLQFHKCHFPSLTKIHG